MPTVLPYVFLLGGIFTIVAATMNWDWFINNHRAKLFVALFGRNGARVVYLILGVLLAGFGAAIAAGIIDTSDRDGDDDYGYRPAHTSFQRV